MPNTEFSGGDAYFAATAASAFAVRCNAGLWTPHSTSPNSRRPFPEQRPGTEQCPNSHRPFPEQRPNPTTEKKAFFIFCAACNSPDIPGGHNNKISGGAFSVRSNAGLYCI